MKQYGEGILPSLIIRNDDDFDRLGRTLGQLKRPFTVQWKQGADRSYDQNNLQWKWAGEVAAHFGDRTAKEVQADWKLRHGVPILRSESPDFCTTYDRLIKPLPFEEKIDAMRLIDVSSIMTVKQMTGYLNTIQREAAENGIRLTIPEGEYA